MTLPVQLQILDEIGARLQLITTANGYSATVRKVDRARLKPFVSGDIPAVNYWPADDSVTEFKYGKEYHELSVTIELHTKTRDNPFTDVSFNSGADIKTALHRTVGAPLVVDAASFALGGLVDKFAVESITPMIGEGQTPWCGVIVQCIAWYYVNPGDSYTIQTI